MFLSKIKEKLQPNSSLEDDIIEEELLMYSNLLEALWEFHPENPDKRDVVKEVNEIKKHIQELNNKLKSK